jgi:hypothetical protein
MRRMTRSARGGVCGLGEGNTVASSPISVDEIATRLRILTDPTP